MLSVQQKAEIISSFATGKGDTGSPQVQVALLTNQIEKLASHLKAHRKDQHSRRGLLKIVSKRRRLLNYLGQINGESLQELVKKLKIGS